MRTRIIKLYICIRTILTFLPPTVLAYYFMIQTAVKKEQKFDKIINWNILWQQHSTAIFVCFVVTPNNVCGLLMWFNQMCVSLLLEVIYLDYTVQLRYMRTTHMRIIRTYFPYTCMSICAHMCIYTRVYVSLLCIQISFFIWSIVGQTRDIPGIKKR